MSESSDITPRHVHFDLSRTPLHWVPGDPFTTHFINPLHLLLPAGERWFVRIYKQIVPSIEDEGLRADVQSFIQQEAIHARVHAEVLAHFTRQGIDVAPYVEKIERFFRGALGDEPLGRWRWMPSLPIIGRQWLMTRLGLIAAIEHLTCVLGRWVLEQRGLDEAGADPVMLDLLRWHGAEEVEHRSVAHQVYRHVGGSYLGRQTHMALFFPAFWTLWIGGYRFIAGSDPSLQGRIPSLREWRRAARQDRLPSLGKLMATLPTYVSIGYDPAHEASTDQALAYLASSPAARAAGSGA